MGRAEGEGRQKGRTSFFFFFYILHREGYLQAGFPPGATFRGPRVLRCPLPFLSWTLSLLPLPRVKRQNSQVMEEGSHHHS
jgi:hypothetical protein